MENLILEHTKDFDQLNTSFQHTINRRVMKQLLKNLNTSHTSSKRLLRERKIKRHFTHFHMSDVKDDLFDSRYVFTDVKKYMATYYTYKLTYTFKVGHRVVEVIFYLENNGEKEMEMCGDRIEKIITLLFFLSSYSTRKCSKHLKIHCCWTNLKKYLPRDMLDVLGVENVNSAVTTSCTPSGSIVIFREEEWFKVLIHELFHVIGLDFSANHSEIYTEKLREILNVNSDYLIFETYSEFWATIINTLFYTYFILYSMTDLEEIRFDDFYTINKVNLNIELTFSLIQMTKILSHMHLNYNILWSDEVKHKSMRNMLYKEDTNVLAYYILKTALLANKDKVFEWCLVHNHNLLNFKETPYNIRLFSDEIVRLSKSNSMRHLVKYGEHTLKKLLKQNMKTDLMSQILHSTRMTLLSV